MVKFTQKYTSANPHNGYAHDTGTNTTMSPSNYPSSDYHKRTWVILIVVATAINLTVQLLGGNACPSTILSASKESQEITTASLRAITTAPTTPATTPPIPQEAPKDPCQEHYRRVTAKRTQGLTDEDVRRAHTYSGNRFRLAQLGRTLQNFQTNPRPIQMVVAGGSISLGHGVELQYRYSNRLEDWLNENYPGPKHTVYNKGSHGADICAMAKRLNLLVQDLPKDIDLFVLEFAVNDYQGQDHETQIDFKMDVFFQGFDEIAMCTESVLYKLLRTYPKASIVFLEMRTAIMERKTASLLHMGAAQHYQVPVISYDQALFPDYQYLLQLLKPFNYSTAPGDTVLPYPHGCHPCVSEHIAGYFRPNGCADICTIQRFIESPLDCTLAPGRVPCTVPFFAHDEVHPSGVGHQIAADLIIDTIATATRDVCRREDSFERMAVLPTKGWMVSEPALLEAKSAFLMVNDTYEIFVERRQLMASLNTPGLTFYDDKFGRLGWIATNEAGGESVQFDIDLPLGECYVPYLSVLKSYENMGQFVVTVKDRVTQQETILEADGLWSPHVSIPSDIQLIQDGVRGCTGNCQVTVTTKSQVPGRGGNKVKIITLSVRRCT